MRLLILQGTSGQGKGYVQAGSGLLIPLKLWEFWTTVPVDFHIFSADSYILAHIH